MAVHNEFMKVPFSLSPSSSGHGNSSLLPGGVVVAGGAWSSPSSSSSSYVSSFSSSSLSLHFFSSAIDDWFCIAFAFSMTDAFATKLHANQKLLQRRDIVWRTGSATHVPSGLCEENTVCFSSLVMFLLVCVDKTCLFLKSRHLPSGLCEENLSVSRVSSSSFWFVWRKRCLFLNYRLKFPSTTQIGEIRSV